MKIRLSDEEYVDITALAQAMGCSPQRVYTAAVASGGAVFGRAALVKQTGLVAELHGTSRLLAAVGRNVNQIARGVNSTGQVAAELSAVLAAVEGCVARVHRVLDEAEL